MRKKGERVGEGKEFWLSRGEVAGERKTWGYLLSTKPTSKATRKGKGEVKGFQAHDENKPLSVFPCPRSLLKTAVMAAFDAATNARVPARSSLIL